MRREQRVRESLLALEQQSHHLFCVRRRREGERKHFVCLVRRDLSALNKTFEKRFPRALPIIKARQKEEEKKYGKGMDFSRSDAEGYAKDINQQYNIIMKNQFRF